MNIGLATARAGNVIGGGDWSPDRIIRDLMRAFERKETLILRNPNSIRPWQHVLDSLNGYLMLAERMYAEPKNFSGSWNFGPNQTGTESVKVIVDIANNYLDRNVPTKSLSGETILHEASILKLNINKAQVMLNWQPTWDLETAVKEAVIWYNLTREGLPPTVVCKDQLDRFQSA